MNIKNKWKYFKYIVGEYRFFASDIRGGYLLLRNGISIHGNDLIQNWSIPRLSPPHTEISELEALKLLDNNLARRKVIKFLNIDNKKKEPVSCEKRNEIIDKLKNLNAFNQDSALKVSDDIEEVCYQLLEENIIKEYGGRFYV